MPALRDTKRVTSDLAAEVLVSGGTKNKLGARLVFDHLAPHHHHTKAAHSYWWCCFVGDGLLVAIFLQSEFLP